MRPIAITVTTLLMGILNILGYALLLDIRRQPSSTIVAKAVVFTVLIAAGYVVLWFYWHGKNWARILVFLTCFVAFYNLRDLAAANPIVKIMLLGEAGVAVFLVFWLNTSEARLFFKNPSQRR